MMGSPSQRRLAWHHRSVSASAEGADTSPLAMTPSWAQRLAPLLTLGDVKCRPALRRALERELDGRVARRVREALRDLGDANTERKRLADDLETLRGEIAELKARFSKLEVKHGGKHGEDSPASAPARKRKGKKRA